MPTTFTALPGWPAAGLALACTALALWLRPWRGVGAGGPPAPWLAWWVAMPLLWSADHLAAAPVVQPLSGACLLVLMAGWPLAVLALLPVALATGWLCGGDWALALHRLLWLGLVPATLTLGIGAAQRRWLPHHLFIYILGRGFLGTALALGLSGTAAAWLQGAHAGLAEEDLVLGRWLSAFGDAWLTGILTAIFVAFRPQWLATYTDRLYLPR
jgi:uncharacterized membrane protein